MEFTAHNVILILVALYLAFFATSVETKNIRSSIVFKLVPLVGGFLLGLMAFKVL